MKILQIIIQHLIPPTFHSNYGFSQNISNEQFKKLYLLNKIFAWFHQKPQKLKTKQNSGFSTLGWCLRSFTSIFSRKFKFQSSKTVRYFIFIFKITLIEGQTEYNQIYNDSNAKNLVSYILRYWYPILEGLLSGLCWRVFNVMSPIFLVL